MQTKSRLQRIESDERTAQAERAGKEHRLMALIARGALRTRGQDTGADLLRLSESELLHVIGTNKENYEAAMRDFVAAHRKA
jgi:hypothetical protein